MGLAEWEGWVSAKVLIAVQWKDFGGRELYFDIDCRYWCRKTGPSNQTNQRGPSLRSD